MNERIRELAEQAGWMMGDEVEGFNIRLEKFAELIVRECAVVINADIEAQIKDGVITNVHGLNQARNLIKQHFGVEE